MMCNDEVVSGKRSRRNLKKNTIGIVLVLIVLLGVFLHEYLEWYNSPAQVLKRMAPDGDWKHSCSGCEEMVKNEVSLLDVLTQDILELRDAYENGEISASEALEDLERIEKLNIVGIQELIDEVRASIR